MGELLCLYPRDYADRRITRVEDTSDGKSYTLLLTVRTPPLLRRGRKVSVCSFLASDESGSIAVTAFNQPWLTSSLKVGEKYRASGRVSIERFARKLEGPVFEKYSPELPELLPVYPLTKGIAQSDVRRAVSAAMECCDQITEFLPRKLIERYSLMGLTEAVKNVHRPFDTKTLEAARRRLAFDELLVYQLGARTVREGSRSLGAPAFTLRNSGAAGFFRVAAVQTYRRSGAVCQGTVLGSRQRCTHVAPPSGRRRQRQDRRCGGVRLFMCEKRVSVRGDGAD